MSRQDLRISAAIAIAVLALVLAAAAVRWRPAAPPRAGDAVPAVAVMSFENLTDPLDADRLGLMLTGLLTTELARAPDLAVVSQQRLFDAAVRLGGDGRVAPQRAAEVARRLAADRMLLGRVSRADGRLTAAVDLVDVASGRVLASHQAEGKTPQDIFAMARALGRQSHRTLRPVRAGAPAAASGLTASLAAYRAYAAGEELLRRKQLEPALAQLREAIRLDPGFVYAHYRLSTAAAWSGADEEAMAAARRAAELARDLPVNERRLIEAAALTYEGRYAAALPRLEALLVDDPENKEALYLASEVYLHSNFDSDVDKAIDLMLVLDALDPDLWPNRYHLVLAFAVRGAVEEASASLESWAVEEPEMADELRNLVLVLTNRPDDVPALSLPLAGTFPYSPHFRAIVTMLTGRWHEARQLVELELGDGHLRSLHLRNRGDLYAYFGEFDAALAAYREAASLAVPGGHEGFTNGVPVGAWGCVAELLQLRGDLAGARQAAEAGVTLQPRNPAARYAAGRLALADGDRAAAEAHLRTVRRDTAASRGPLAEVFARALEAELLLAAGEAAEAARLYREVVGSGTLMHESFTSSSSSGAAFRDGLARASRAMWDQAGEAAALTALLASGFERLDHPVLYVRAFYRLAELRLEAGDEAAAQELFGRFLEHWGRADWELAEVAEARAFVGRAAD